MEHDHRPVSLAQGGSRHHLPPQPHGAPVQRVARSHDASMAQVLPKFFLTMADNYSRHRNDTRSVLNMALIRRATVCTSPSRRAMPVPCASVTP